MWKSGKGMALLEFFGGAGTIFCVFPAGKAVCGFPVFHMAENVGFFAFSGVDGLGRNVGFVLWISTGRCGKAGKYSFAMWREVFHRVFETLWKTQSKEI